MLRIIFMIKLLQITAPSIVLILSLFPIAALAHRDDYISETLVYLTVPRQVLEPEYWLDYGFSQPAAFHFLRHNFSTEYGITNHWQVEFVAALLDTLSGRTCFQSALFETRGRFFEEGTLPVDLALSGEFNTERDPEGGRTYGLEPRLVLSKDPNPQANFTLNLPFEIPLHDGEFSFEPSLGGRYNAGKWLRLAGELKYLSDSRQTVFVPQVWFALPHELLLKTGAILGAGSSRDTFFRLALEMDIGIFGGEAEED